MRGYRVKIPDLTSFFIQVKIGAIDQLAIYMLLHTCLKHGFFAETDRLFGDSIGGRKKPQKQPKCN